MIEDLSRRVEALERALGEERRAARRKLRGWQAACLLLVAGWAVLGGLRPSLAARAAALSIDLTDLDRRVDALEKKLHHFSRRGNDVFISGANLHIQNGRGSARNGLGNLIVGYNSNPNQLDRSGSHNVVVGDGHGYSSVGGIVSGFGNRLQGESAVVLGSIFGTASREGAVVLGGLNDTAAGPHAVAIGGFNGTAAADRSVVLGGQANTASELYAMAAGGSDNTASGRFSVVTGGGNNVASGSKSVVSGGGGVTQATDVGWAAGSLGPDEPVVGNFRSP